LKTCSHSNWSYVFILVFSFIYHVFTTRSKMTSLKESINKLLSWHLQLCFMHKFPPNTSLRFLSVIIIINSVPTSSLSFSTPYRILFQKDPDYSFFKIFGCKCYPYTRPYASHKLTPRSSSCIFLDYSSMYN
jgi:hypothetical protein